MSQIYDWKQQNQRLEYSMTILTIEITLAILTIIKVTFQAQAPGWQGWFGEAQCWEALRAWRGGRVGRWGRRGWWRGAGSWSSAPANQKYYFWNCTQIFVKIHKIICKNTRNNLLKYTKLFVSGLLTWERKELWGRGVCKLETKFETVTGMLWPVSCNKKYKYVTQTNTKLQQMQICIMNK